MNHGELITTALRRLAAAAFACALLAAVGCAGGQAKAARETPQAGNSPVAAASSPALAPAPPTRSAGPSGQAHRRRLPLAGEVIVLDPGHNGGNAAHPEIINQLVNVITERKPCDTTGTRVHADVAISIHADGGPPGGYGFEVIEPGLVPGYTDKIIAPSRRLGLDIRNAYHAVAGEPYSTYIGTAGIDVRTDLGGLNLSRVPKVFIECANMRNTADAARLTSAAFRQRVAVALADGFSAFLHGS